MQPSRYSLLLLLAAPTLAAAAALSLGRLPLLTPAEPVPFPFPVGAALPLRSYRYTFDSPARIRLLRSVEEQQEEDALLGHCVCTADGVTPAAAEPGAVGVALRLTRASRSEFGGEVATATAAASCRFVVREIVGTFPFSVGRAEPLHDDEALLTDAADALEVEAEELLARLVALTATLGAALEDPALEEAGEALAAPGALLAAHARRKDAGAAGAAGAAGVAGAPYGSRRERLEAFSLGACELIAMPPAVAAQALATVSAEERLRLLLGQLRPLLAELDALKALGALEGAAGSGVVGGEPGAPWKLRVTTADAAPRRHLPSGFRPVDINLDANAAGGAPAQRAPPPQRELPAGTRIEFWWNEEWGWSPATVTRAWRGESGQLMHSLSFDGYEDQPEDAALEFDDGGQRWRPLGPRRDS